MDARLSAKLRPEFVASLYPALVKDGACVADDEDGDDDASAPL
jgi:hypothetical protein